MNRQIKGEMVLESKALSIIATTSCQYQGGALAVMSYGDYPPPRGQNDRRTDTCENITFPQRRLQAVKKDGAKLMVLILYN